MSRFTGWKTPEIKQDGGQGDQHQSDCPGQNQVGTNYLAEAEGGLKGVVQAERRLRAEENGKQVTPRDEPRPALAKKLRKLDAKSLEHIAADGPEFALVMIRRTDEGEVVVLGEVSDDIPLIERVARKLVK